MHIKGWSSLTPAAAYGCLYIDLHKAHVSLTALCKESKYGI